MAHRRLNWQDGIEVIAVPLHAFVVCVAGALRRNELPVHQLYDVFYRRGHGKMRRIRDGAVAGMTLMGAPVLTVEQVGIHRDSSKANVQENGSLGREKKFLLLLLNKGIPHSLISPR